MGDSLGSIRGQIELDISDLEAKIRQAKALVASMDGQGKQAFSGLDGSASRIDQLNSKADAFEQKYRGIGVGLGVFSAAVFGGIGLGLSVLNNFDAQMSAVGATAGATTEQMAALREEALRLGADTTFGATEAAQAMEVMLKAGASLEDVLNGGTEAVLNLAAATGTDVVLAAETAATAINQFGGTYEDVANTITQASNASALDVNDFALALKTVGPIATTLGYDFQELANMMVILGDAGIKGEVGATALRNILMGIADPAGEGAEALRAYGVEVQNADGSMKDLQTVTSELTTAWADLTEAQKLQLAQSIAGEQGAASFIAIMDAQTEAASRNADAFEEAEARQKATGTASEQAQKRMDNLRGSIEKLKGVLETIAITFTSGLAAPLRVFVDALAGALSVLLSLPQPLQNMVTYLGLAAGAFAGLASAAILGYPQLLRMQAAFAQLAIGAPRLAAALKLVGLALGIFGLAALAGIVAYKTNFLGFGDAVDRVVKQLAKFGTMFKSLNRSMNPVTAALKTLGILFPSLKRYTDQLAEAADNVARRFTTFTESMGFLLGRTDPLTAALRSLGNTFPSLRDNIAPVLALITSAKEAFSDFREQGANPLQAALLTLGAVFPVLAGYVDGVLNVFDLLGDAVTDVGEAFRAFADGNYAEGFRQLGEAAVNAGRAIIAGFGAVGTLIQDVFNAIPWGTIGAALLSGARTAVAFMADAAAGAWDWIREQVDAIPWNTIGTVLRLGAAIAAGYIKNAATGLWDWLTEQVDAIPWNTIGAVLRLGASVAAGYIKNAATGLWDWIQEQVSRIPWDTIGAGMRSGASTAAGYIKNAATGLWNWIGEQAATIGWDSIGASMRGGAATAAGYLLNAIAGVWDWIATQADEVNWPAIGESLRTGWASAVSTAFAFGEGGGKQLLSLGTRLLTWITEEIDKIEWNGVGERIGRGLVTAVGLAIAGIAGLATLGPAFVAGLVKAVVGADWSAVAKAALTMIKVSFEFQWGILEGIGKGLADVLRAPVEAAFSGIVEAIRPYINEIIGLVNQLIDAWNVIAPGQGMERIPLVLSETEQAAKRATDAAKRLKEILAGSQGNDSDGGVQGDGPPPLPPIPSINDQGDPNGQKDPKDFGGWIPKFVAQLRQVDSQLLTTNTGVGAFKGAIGGIGTVATPAFAGLKAAFDASIPAVTLGFQQAPTLWQAPVAAALAGVKGAFDTTLPGIAAVTMANFSAAKSSAVSNADAMKSGVSTAAQGMHNVVLSESTKIALLSAIQSKLMQNRWETAARGMAQTAATVFNGMQVLSGLAFSQMATQAQQAGQRMQQAMQSGAQGAANAVRSALGQIPGIISSIGGAAAGVARGVGANIGNAMAQGMESALGRIRAAANAMVAAAETALNAAAMISSPSRVFMKKGYYIAEGTAVGIEDGIPLVEQSMRDLFGAMDHTAGRAMMGTALAAPTLPAAASNTSYVLNIGEITVQAADDPAATGDVVIERIKTAWSGQGALR